MKTKIITLLGSLIVLLVVIQVIVSYSNLYNSERIPICNLKSTSTGSCYVYLNVHNRNKKSIIVCPNSNLYYNLRDEKWMAFPYVYIYRLGNIIEKEQALNLSDNLHKKIENYIVDMNRVNRFMRYKELTKDTSIIKNDYINYKLGWENEKAIIYLLLKRGINCCYNCEGGITNVYFKGEQLH